LSEIPRAVEWLLHALRSGDGGAATDFSPSEWEAALYFFHRHQLALALRGLDLPGSIDARLDRDYESNGRRIERMKRAFFEASTAISPEFVALKGFAHWEQFSPDPASRVQYDIDLYCPRGSEVAAGELRALGYEPSPGVEKFPTDHLPPLIRRTGWQWRGDFFDPEIPIAIDLHFRLWDEKTEGFSVPGIEAFWDRRVERSLDGHRYWALDPADALAYASLHFLRHLFRGALRLSDAREISYFLNRSASDDAFWTRWASLHPAKLRRVQAVAFRLASEWFGCALHPAARAETDLLPAAIRRWFDEYAMSPIASFFRPNKDELWLHLCLVDSFRARASVLRRRLAPARLPGPLDAVYIPRDRMNWKLRLRKRWEYSRYAAGRALFHLRALAPTFSRMFRIRL
jgi:hypothetical protein